MGCMAATLHVPSVWTASRTTRTNSSAEPDDCADGLAVLKPASPSAQRSEEHTSELQSHLNIVCRLLLEKKNTLVLSLRGTGSPLCRACTAGPPLVRPALSRRLSGPLRRLPGLSHTSVVSRDPGVLNQGP